MAEKLAFGVEPSRRAYRLRLARYVALADAVAAHVRTVGDARPGPLRLLDVGVGTGRAVRYIEAAGVADRLELIGIDVATDRLVFPERWILVRGDIEKGLPFADDSFDVVTCEQVLEHVHDPARLVAEMDRILRPGGLLVVGTPIFPPGLAFIRKHIVPPAYRLFGIESTHIQAFSVRSLAKTVRRQERLNLCKTRGFRIVSGGILGLLEDSRWWWRLNPFIGRLAPGICTEAQIIAIKQQQRTDPIT